MWVLVHAAAGGVGLLLVQIAKGLGASILGLTSSADKAQNVLATGAAAAALHSEDWVGKARELSGDGVDVAYDSVRSTLPQTFSSKAAATRARCC